jgi:hypothetical protein
MQDLKSHIEMHRNNSADAAASATSEVSTHATKPQQFLKLPLQTSFLIDMWWGDPGVEPLRAFTSSPRKLVKLIRAAGVFVDIRVIGRRLGDGQQDVVAGVSATYATPGGTVTFLLDTGELLVSVDDAEPQKLDRVHWTESYTADENPAPPEKQTGLNGGSRGE